MNCLANPLQLSLLPRPQQSLPVRELSPSQLQTSLDKWLCYKCDEKFFSDINVRELFVLIQQNGDEDKLDTHHHRQT